MNLLTLFIIVNVANVIIQTIKSLCTINSGKTIAAIVNALAYGFYTYVVVLTVCDLPLLTKCLVVAAANFVGVFIVKWIEEKSRKDKLWKIEATVNSRYTENLDLLLKNIPHSYIRISDKHTLFNFYCATQAQSKQVHDIMKCHNAKFFASESKKLY